MELLKKKIHMAGPCVKTIDRFPLEDDMNIPDVKPDVGYLSMERGEVILEEIRPEGQGVFLKGRLHLSLLYVSDESREMPVPLEGNVPFERKISLAKAEATDHFNVKGILEDLHISLINSRKLGIQALVAFSVQAERYWDEEIPVEVLNCKEREESPSGTELSMEPECAWEEVETATLAVCKDLVYPMKEEIGIPAAYPNIYRILWEYVRVGEMQFRPMKDKIGICGELQVFVIYEGEDGSLRTTETVSPINTVLDCVDCEEDSYLEVVCTTGRKEVAAAADGDGEDRNIAIDLKLDLSVKVYREETVQAVKDLYCVNLEVEAEKKPLEVWKLLGKYGGKKKITGPIPMEDNPVRIFCSEGVLIPGEETVTENGIRIRGNLSVKTLYSTDREEQPFKMALGILPYEYLLEIPDIESGDSFSVEGCLENLQVTMADGQEPTVSAVVTFETLCFRRQETELPDRLVAEEADSGKRKNMPGVVIYTVKPGDTLWKIGKTYYVTVDALMKQNDLSSEQLQPGQRLLVVKGS